LYEQWNNYKVIVEGPKLGFCAAHFLPKHEKCGRLHGHNYKVKVEIFGELNEDNMVIDFSILKKYIKTEVNLLDHKLILPENNPSIKIINSNSNILIQKEQEPFFIAKTAPKNMTLLHHPYIISRQLLTHFLR